MPSDIQQFSLPLLDSWEKHMDLCCPGRNSAFDLSAELLFSYSCASKSKYMSVLDMACGFGSWSRILQEEGKKRGKQIHFTGLDESEARLAVFRKSLGGNTRIKPGKLTLSLPSLTHECTDAYDAVLLGWAAHEMPFEELEWVYTQAIRLLKPDGLMLIADFVSHENALIPKLSQHLTHLRTNQFSKKFALHIDQANFILHNEHGSHGKSTHSSTHYGIKEHISALGKAGFVLKEEIWRHMNSSLIMAVNPG